MHCRLWKPLPQPSLFLFLSLPFFCSLLSLSFIFLYTLYLRHSSLVFSKSMRRGQMCPVAVLIHFEPPPSLFSFLRFFVSQVHTGHKFLSLPVLFFFQPPPPPSPSSSSSLSLLLPSFFHVLPLFPFSFLSTKKPLLSTMHFCSLDSQFWNSIQTHSHSPTGSCRKENHSTGRQTSCSCTLRF